jgi:hypothetical protein
MVAGLSIYINFPEYDAERVGVYLYNVSSTELFEYLTSEDYVGYVLEQERFYTPCLYVHDI